MDSDPLAAFSDLDSILLQSEARSHGNVVPVPFLGVTWKERGGAYWWRRVGAIAVMAGVTQVVGFMAAGFTVGIVGSEFRPVRLTLAVGYDVTAVVGFAVGRRLLARAPLVDSPPGLPQVFLPNTILGGLTLLFAPFGVGLCLAMLASMVGRDFMGERRAREITEALAESTRHRHH